MEKIGVRDLIKAGAHFGHRTSRWNPKMEPYILKKRNLIHLIDLRETLRGFYTAAELARAVAQNGEYVLFAGTKRQARELVRREAKRCGMPYVADRWPGGLLTNYVTIRSRLERLLELERLEETGELQNFSKKMISSLQREKRKIQRNLGGVRNMDSLPGLVVIIDPLREYIAADEALKLEIPSVALMDTDGDPDKIDVPVPSNDDSMESIGLFLRTVADAVLEGKKAAKRGPSSEAKEAAAEAEEAEEAEETEETEETDEAEAAEETEETEAEVSAEAEEEEAEAETETVSEQEEQEEEAEEAAAAEEEGEEEQETVGAEANAEAEEEEETE